MESRVRKLDWESPEPIDMAVVPGWRRFVPPFLMVAPLVVVSTVFFVVPLLTVARFTFNQPVAGGLMREAWTWTNYLKFVSDPFCWRAAGNTLLLGLSTVVTTLLIGFPFAYLLARSQVGRSVQMTGLLAPLLVNIVVRVYGWDVLLSDSGVINKLLLALGIIHEPIQVLYTPWAVIVGLTHVLLPYMVLAIFSVIDGLDPSYEEAARTLGASPLKVLRTIVLPLALPGVAAGSVLVFSSAAGSFLVPAILGGGRLHTIPTLVYTYAVGLMNWPFGATLAFVLALAMLPPLLISQRRLGREGGGGISQ